MCQFDTLDHSRSRSLFHCILAVLKRIHGKSIHLFSRLLCYAIHKTHAVLPAPKTKIYDCFLFNDEIDLLRLRLAELCDSVDFFVICECASTFSGKSKPLYYLENKSLFENYHGKIIHFIIPDPPSEAYTDNPTNSSLKTSQFWQRSQMVIPIQSVNDNDLILVSDVDEIPRSSVLPKVAKICHFAKTIVFFSQTWYLLFLDVRVIRRDQKIFAFNRHFKNQTNAKWLGTYACTASALWNLYNGNVNSIWSLKWNNSNFNFPIVENSGWHFSYMGGVHALISKIENNGVIPYTSRDVQDLSQGRFIGSTLNIETIGNDHPAKIQENPQSWNHLLIQQDSFRHLASQLEIYLAELDATKFR